MFRYTPLALNGRALYITNVYYESRYFKPGRGFIQYKTDFHAGFGLNFLQSARHILAAALVKGHSIWETVALMIVGYFQSSMVQMDVLDHFSFRLQAQ
jgi:hypothetical protein